MKYATIALVLLATPASATVIDLHPDFIGAVPSYTQDGFLFTNLGNALGAQFEVDPNGMLINATRFSSTRVERVNGQPFTLLSMGFASYAGTVADATVDFGHTVGLNATFNITVLSDPGIQTFLFNQHNVSFFNVTTFFNVAEFDFLDIGTEATPLPGTLALFGTGLGLLGWLARRRHTAPTLRGTP